MNWAAISPGLSSRGGKPCARDHRCCGSWQFHGVRREHHPGWLHAELPQAPVEIRVPRGDLAHRVASYIVVLDVVAEQDTSEHVEVPAVQRSVCIRLIGDYCHVVGRATRSASAAR